MTCPHLSLKWTESVKWMPASPVLYTASSHMHSPDTIPKKAQESRRQLTHQFTVTLLLLLLYSTSISLHTVLLLSEVSREKGNTFFLCWDSDRITPEFSSSGHLLKDGKHKQPSVCHIGKDKEEKSVALILTWRVQTQCRAVYLLCATPLLCFWGSFFGWTERYGLWWDYSSRTCSHFFPIFTWVLLFHLSCEIISSVPWNSCVSNKSQVLKFSAHASQFSVTPLRFYIEAIWYFTRSLLNYLELDWIEAARF